MTYTHILLTGICLEPSIVKEHYLDCPTNTYCSTCILQTNFSNGRPSSCVFNLCTVQTQADVFNTVTSPDWSASKYMQDNPEYFI